MIELLDVHKAFGANRVLQGVTLAVPRGQSMVIIGGSGTGKSVLLKCILGLVHPDRGTIRVDGQDADTTARDAFLARFGMLFQGGALFDSLPVWQNVAFRLLRGALKRPKAEARAIAIEKLRRVGLKPEVADLFPAELSGGMQKRVGIARAIANDPKYLFCDEPNSGLDPQTSIVIDELIQQITEEYKTTTIVITHDMNSVMDTGENILFIHEGRVGWKGARSELVRSDNTALNEFIFASALMREVREALKRR
jgi:phospholipid/cholesterol/gamma-HCH transport system ATP-binding protein